MLSAAKQISAAIAAAVTSSISIEKFMELSLYSENGFYNTIGKAGRRGDFITSPEVGPLFGAVIARAIDARWHELDCPEKFTIVEVGAGPKREILPVRHAVLVAVARHLHECAEGLHLGG